MDTCLAYTRSEDTPTSRPTAPPSTRWPPSTPTARLPRAVVEGFFAGFEVVEPGLVYAPAWRPDSAADPLRDEPSRAPNWAGVGRKL